MVNNDYLRLFLDEAEEIVDRLALNLVSFEKHPSDTDLLNEVFRDAHTIKGSAAAMGFTQMASVAHQMENVLTVLRQGQIMPEPALFSALLSGLDALRQIKHDVYAAGKESTYDLAAVVASLTGFSQALVETAAACDIAPSAASVTHRVEITLRTATVMKGVRAFILLKRLRELGEIVRCEPKEQDLTEERFEHSFVVEMHAEQNAGSLSEAVGQDGDVEDVRVTGLAAPTGKLRTNLEKQATERADTKQHSVRVDVNKLEKLMNLVGELVIERNRLANVVGNLERASKDNQQVQTLLGVSGQLGRITSELQQEIMKARMIPIAQLFSTFPRLVRDLAQNRSKQVELELLGTETELDRTIVEEVRDPLIHIVRNAIDHGLESKEERLRLNKSPVGRVVLAASHEETNVVISIKDDGRGIDREAVGRKALSLGLVTEEELRGYTEQQVFAFIFAPGLSTAREVSDVSGRGVGMDIVRTQLEKLGGSIEITSELNVGTEFVIRLPLTLAIIRALLVSVEGRSFALPIAAVSETRKLNPQEVRVVQQRDCLVIREQIVPLVSLASALALPSAASTPEHLVIVFSASSKVALMVDRLLGEQEVVIKPLGPFFAANRELAGATVLGDGSVVPILDVKGLLGLLRQQ
ncbi:MAG: Chemotaxis protein CheA [Firmicutes bacterium]|nr:Chemotaxis protein CheA [candidate division NPL-UPA2 bacterium]